MEGFCILRAGKLVIGSAISCCANRRQQTKCERCIRFPRYLFGIGRILAVNRNEIVTITDDIWRGGAVHQRWITWNYNSISLRLPSISLHLDWTSFKIRRRFKGKFNFDFLPIVAIVREVQEARQLKLVVEMNENDPEKIENQSLPMTQMPSKAPTELSHPPPFCSTMIAWLQNSAQIF